MCGDLKKRMDENLEIYDEVIADFVNLYLFPAEVMFWIAFGSGGVSSMCSISGSGLAGLLGSSAKILNPTRRSTMRRSESNSVNFSEASDRRFAVGDARELSGYADESFDFILLSYNGIDYIDPEGREAAMAEIKRVLKPRGWFFFSSHSLDIFPFNPPLAEWLRGMLSPLGHLLRIRKRLKLKWRNRRVDVKDAKERGWACLVDYADSMTTYYIDPGRQLEQLEALGYRVDATWDTKGRSLGKGKASEEWMIHYIAQKALS